MKAAGLLLMAAALLLCGSSFRRCVEDREPVSETDTETETVIRYALPLDDDVQQYVIDLCREKEIPASIVFAVIDTESGCNPECVGDGGNSWGLMQIYATQHTARCVRLGAWNLLDPYQNIRVGVDFLQELAATGHDWAWVLSWYNGHGGDPCEYAETVLARAQELTETVSVITITN